MKTRREGSRDAVDGAARRGTGVRPAPGGFSLIEVLVGLAIVVVLATVVTPNVVGMLDTARIDRAAASLENLADAVADFEEDVNRAPSSLTHLVEPIGSDDLASCGKKYPPGLASKWAGPYLNRVVPATGLPIAIGSVSTQLDEADDGAGRTLRFHVEKVAEEDAIELQRRIDGDDNPMAGAVRFSGADGQGLVALYYHLPIKGC